MLQLLLNNYNVGNYDISVNNVDDNILNQFKIYVINLRKDKTRRSYIKTLFKKHKINYSLIIVDKFCYKSNEDKLKFRLNEAVLGCVLSHLWCLKNAVFSGYEQFIIFEDDIIFHKNFTNLFANIMSKYIFS